MKVFLDMDGVLVDFVKGALLKHGHADPYQQAENLGNWDIDHMCCTSKEERDNYWKSFDYDFWRNLDWMPDGKDILSHIEERFGKENIRIFTAPTRANRGACIDAKLDWAEEHLPGYQVMTGRDKGFCASEGILLIDDADHNVEAYQKNGPAYLVPRLWNSRHALADIALEHLKTTIR